MLNIACPLNRITRYHFYIKIFSLVSKICREKDHLLPVLEKVDDDGYEGAIVIEPIKGVNYDPIMVLDYASLYPRSMMMMNLSHECQDPTGFRLRSDPVWGISTPNQVLAHFLQRVQQLL